MLLHNSCLICGKPTRGLQSKFCSAGHRRQHNKNRYDKANPPTGLSSGTVGAVGELVVAIDLLKRGYHVFRAMSPACPCDLAILKNGKVVRVEVKTVSYSPVDPSRPLINTAKTAARRKHGAFDVFAGVTREGLHIYYDPPLETLFI